QHLGARADEGAGAVVRADVDDASAADRDGLRVGIRAVDGVDGGIEEDVVGRFRAWSGSRGRPQQRYYRRHDSYTPPSASRSHEGEDDARTEVSRGLTNCD